MPEVLVLSLEEFGVMALKGKNWKLGASDVPIFHLQWTCDLVSGKDPTT